MKKQTKKKEAPKIDISEDVSNPKPAGDLSRVAQLSQKLVLLDDKVTRIQAELELTLLEKQRIEAKDLPDLMTEVGLKDFSLVTGESITIKEITKASLPSQGAIDSAKDLDERTALMRRFNEGIKFLEVNGAGTLVKLSIDAELGKGQHPLAKKAIAALKALGITASIGVGVNSNSLSAWVKERIENAAEVPMDVFKVYTGSIAKIKRPIKKAQANNLPEQKPAAKGAKSLF